MSNILKKPKNDGTKNVKAKYEALNLEENPFPVTPFVNKVSPDDRYNGSIYEASIREKERAQIIENFIKVPQSNPNHVRLGYILDNSYVGRGNGKSAFAINLINEINNEYCLDISNEVNKCFGLHISPETGGRTKTFYSFTDLIFDAIFDKGIIEYCLASLRLESILNVFPGKVDLENDFESDEHLVEKLNDHSWFGEKEIEIARLTNDFYQKEEFAKISTDFPLNRDRNVFYGTRVITKQDFKKYYYEGLKKGKERIHFIFNDMVLFLQAAGFNGAYLIVDDFERIPDFQSEKLKQEFALELRTNFFDGILENAKIGFFNLILILHAGVPRLLEKAWTISGMDRRSPMLIEDEISSGHIINFDKLTVKHAKSLIEIYLNQYRLDANKQTGLFPFTEKAIELISEKAELNAAAILEKSHTLIEQAVRENVTEIDDVFVKAKMGEIDDMGTEDVENISKEASEDLFKKAKKKN